jgi:DNA-binding beta-propeller fold protein YncE
MEKRRVWTSAAALAALGAVMVVQQGCAPDTIREEPYRVGYQEADGWIATEEEIGGVSGVDVGPDGRVWAFRRNAGNVWTLSSDGRLLAEWGQDIARWTHGIRVDPEGFVWTVDGQGHQIKKWSPDASELLMTLGQYNVSGVGPDTFNRPTDVAVAPNGDFYVSDGYVNGRVAQFDRAGNFIRDWGERGDGPGQFNTVHSIVIDRRARVLVADRDNHRIQIYDLEGNPLEVWTHLGSPYSLFITADDLLYVSDGVNSKIWIARAESGELLETIEDLDGVHWAAVAPDHTVYAASNRSSYLRKFVKAPR